jgi:hypothetical protein
MARPMTHTAVTKATTISSGTFTMLTHKANVSLTLPILHDTCHAVTHDISWYSGNGGRKGLKIEKRNNKIGDKERLKGARYAP